VHPGERSLAGHDFQAGRDYDLIVFDRLSPEEQVLLAELRDDPQFYGILRPRDGSARTIRAVDRDTALLWLGAQARGRLPFFVWESGADPALTERRVLQLVLDGVLEIELGGEFVSGARALPILPQRDAGRAGRLGALSRQALQYGAKLRLEEPDDLAARLYGYGALPLSPAWSRRVTDRADVLRYLGADRGTALHRRLASGFTRAPDHEAGSWIAWSRSARGTPAGGAGDPTYKLYLSPLPDELPGAFAILVEVLLEHEQLQFKVGGSAMGLLRPDKLVVYLDSRESLQRLAEVLADALKSIAPQGVPFSADVAGNGLLSWGMDPPRKARQLAWQGYDSWRLWVVRRLASAMTAAQRDVADEVEVCRHAVERLRLDGVDVDDWTPSCTSWWLA
jgi:hypothetical protein